MQPLEDPTVHVGEMRVKRQIRYCCYYEISFDLMGPLKGFWGTPSILCPYTLRLTTRTWFLNFSLTRIWDQIMALLWGLTCVPYPWPLSAEDDRERHMHPAYPHKAMEVPLKPKVIQ